MHVSRCRLRVFNCGNFHSALAAHVMHGTVKSDPPTQCTHTRLHTNYSSPSPCLSSRAAQNSALRHMWKQFSQCSEQGSPHTHKQTYTPPPPPHTHTDTRDTLISRSPFTYTTHRHTHTQHAIICYSYLFLVEVLIAWHLTVC